MASVSSLPEAVAAATRPAAAAAATRPGAAAPAAASSTAARGEAEVSPVDSDKFWSLPGDVGEGGPPGGPLAAGPSWAAKEASNTMAEDVVAVEERRGQPVRGRGPYFDFSGESRAPEIRPQSHGDEALPSPTRSQQPVRLTPEGALAFEMLEEGQGPQLERAAEEGAPGGRGRGGNALQTSRRRSSSRIKAMGDSTVRRVEAQFRRGACPFLLLFSSAAVLVFLFLQELIFNISSFNGRCIGNVLYPAWTEPPESRMPTLVPFGYGACEANLGLLEEEGAPEDPSPLVQLPSVQGQQQQHTSSFRKRCGFGACAGDKGWPVGRVNGGERAASKAPGDSPNPRILGVMGALDSNMIRNYGEIYRVFWAANLHGGWVHLIVNILCQTAVLFILEPVWGFWRCLLTWFVGAMSGNLLSAVLDPCTITVGSSGALYGLLGGLVPFCLGEGRFPCLFEKKMKEELKRQPVDGPPFVWRFWEGCLEWFVRLVALSFLVVSLVYLWLYLLNPAYYETLKTPGRISFLGSIGCNCCRLPSRLEIETDSVLSLLPAHHTIRANAGAFWCFESPYYADFFCGKMFRDGTISFKPAETRRHLHDHL
ncbi:hypothetical protein Esti_006635 [Eimeria stiedai]